LCDNKGIWPIKACITYAESFSFGTDGQLGLTKGGRWGQLPAGAAGTGV